MVLAAIILPLALSLLLSIDHVQKLAVDATARYLSGKLGTEITVRDVDIRLFNKAVLGGVYMEDFHRDTLLYAESVSATVSPASLLGGRIVLGDVALQSPRFYLIQDSTGRTNLTQILSPFKKKEKKKKGNFRLAARTVAISDMHFRFRKFTPRERPYGVNFDDIEVKGFELRTHDLSIVRDSVTLAIDRIAFAEKSGFRIDALSSGTFAISGKGMYFNKLKIDMPDSRLDMPYLYFVYDSWKDYKYFLQKVRIQSEVTDSKVSYATIAMFAPTLRDWKSVYEKVSLTVDGPVTALTGNVKHLECLGTKLSVKFSIDGIPDIPNTRFRFEVPYLSTSGHDARAIINDITRRSNPKTDELLDRLGHIGFTGRFDGLFSDFKATGALRSPQGDADLNINIRPLADGRRGFDGEIHAHDLDIGHLFEISKMGKITVYADVNGALDGKNINFSTTASVRQMAFNGYDYNGITVKGDFQDKFFNGHIGSADPNLAFDFNGALNFNDSVPRYNFDLKLRSADLVKLNINHRDSISKLSCDVMANGSGLEIDKLNGQLQVSSLQYVNHLDTVRTGSIILHADNDERLKQLSLRSSFADVDFRGRASYDKMISYFRNTLVTYLPSLHAGPKTDEPPASQNGRDGTTDINDYYIINMNVKEANNVAGIFLPGLELAQGTNLAFLFNPESDVFSLTLKSDYIERGGFFASNLNLSGKNQSDSISLYVGADDLFVGGLYLPDFSVIGGAKNNKLNLATRFNNTENNTDALINTTSVFRHNPDTGMPEVAVNITSSALNTGAQTWRIMARDIVYDSTKVTVRRFRIANGEQSLSIDGTASANRSDTLHVRLRNFDLTPLSRITNRQGYAVSGLTNGYADISAALGESLIASEIAFDSIRVNDIPFPSTVFESRWDFLSERARFLLRGSQGNDTIMLGFYRPTDRRYRADIEMNDVQLSLLDPLLGGVLRETGGRANARLRVVGQSGIPKFSGRIDVPSFSSTVDYTNVRYTMNDAVINVDGNVLSMPGATLHDPGRGRARLDMSVDLNHLSNIVYDIRIAPEKCIVLNTSQKDNDQFYGTIFASGTASIHGDKSGTKMNIVATTDDNSAFFMPLNSSKSVGETDFIQFHSPQDKAEKKDDIVSLKKEAFAMRRARRKKNTGGGLEMNMTVNVKPNAEMQLVIDPTVGDIIRGSGNGTINMRINPRNNDFTIYGDYEITEGSYLFTLKNIVNKRFVINPGSTIQWTGDPVNAMLNITATYKLKASLAPLLSSNDENYRRRVPVDCEIHLGDRLLQPAISFNVQVPNVDPETQSLVNNAINTQEMMATQFIWLLAVNSFYSESSNTNQSVNIGAMGGTVTGIEFLTNQLSNWLSTDKFSLVPRYRPKSEVTSDEFGFEFSAELIKNRLIFEGEGSYDSGNNISATNRTANNLTGDFYLTWIFDQEGSFKAKAFTRTIDRFDENQGLQESGIGIYYREDFNTVGDIVRKFKERIARMKLSFSKKARKEKQEAGENAQDKK